MNKIQATEAIIKLTYQCLEAIDAKPWHPEMKEAMKENLIKNCHDKSIEAVLSGKFKNIKD